MVAVLVEGYQCGHWYAGRFQTDEEHQEVTGGNHQVHSQKGGKSEKVEFTLLESCVGAAHPFMSHQENNECTDTQNGFYDVLNR